MKKRVFTFLLAATLLVSEMMPVMPAMAAAKEDFLEEDLETGVSQNTVSENGIAESEEIAVSTKEVQINEAAEPAMVSVYVDDGLGDGPELVNTSKEDAEGGWSYDGSTSTLTLSGFEGKSIYALGDLNIVLDGENSITVPVDLGYGVKSDGKLTIDDTTSPQADSLSVSGNTVVTQTLLMDTGAYGDEKAAYINGGTISLAGSSETSAIIGVGKWLYINNDASLSVHVSDEETRRQAVCAASATYVNTSGEVSFTTDSTYEGSYSVYSLYKNGTGNLNLTATGYVANIYYTFSIGEEAAGVITVDGYLPRCNPNKAYWTVEGKDNFLWKNTVQMPGYLAADYVCDSDGTPIKNLVLMKVQSQPFTMMDSVIFDVPETKVGDEFYFRPKWTEGCRGGTGTYNFELAEDSEPLPAGISIDYWGGGMYGTVTEPHAAGVAKIKVISGSESTTFEVNYGEVQDRDYILNMDGTEVNMAEDNSGEGWTYTAETTTLTLSGYEGGPISSQKSFTAVLDGANTITVPVDGGYGIKSEGKLTIDDTTSPQADSLTITVTDATTQTLLIDTGAYGEDKAAYIDGGSVNLMGSSETSAIIGVGRWLYVNNDASLRVHVSDEETRRQAVCAASATYVNTSGEVSFTTDSTYEGSYSVYSLYKNGTGNLNLTATGYAANIYYTFAIGEEADGVITVDGYLPRCNPNKAYWTVEGKENFLWKNTVQMQGYLGADYVCDSNGTPIKSLVLKKVPSQPLKMMDSIVFDVPATKVGDDFYFRPTWTEGCRGGTGTYNFELAEDSEPLPAGISIDYWGGGMTGKPTKTHAAGVAKVKVSSGSESTTFEVNYGAITWNNPVSEMTLDKEEEIIGQGESVELTATVLPADADSCNVSWSYDNQYLNISEATPQEGSNLRSAEFTAQTKAGKTTVTAATEIGNIKDSCTIYIKEAVPEAFVTPGGVYIGGLEEGETYLINEVPYVAAPMEGFSGYGIEIDVEWAGTTLSIVHKNAEENCNSEEQLLAIPASLIPEELSVAFPGPVLEAEEPTRNDVKIMDATGESDLTDILVSCANLYWTPGVVEEFAGGTVYTAGITLNALGTLTFPEEVQPVMNCGDVKISSVEYELSANQKNLIIIVVFERTVPDGLWIDEIEEQNYTGKQIKPEAKVYYRDQLLTNKQYSVSYKNNTNAASKDAVNAKGKSVAPTIVITGKGNFKGTVTKTFTILPINLDDYETDEELKKILEIQPVYKKKTGNKILGVPVFKLNGKAIKVSAKQYTLEYNDATEGAYTNVGDWDITIVGAGKNFTGSTTVKQTISDKLISKVKIKLDKKSYPYNVVSGETYPTTIKVYDGTKELTENTHYTVKILNYDRIGTATVVITGIGEYSGSKTKNYQITGTKLTKYMVKQLAGFVYDETQHGVVKDVNYTIMDKETALVEGTDYEISYSGDRTKAGKFKVTFKGIKKYTGSVTKTYIIAQAQASSLNVTLSDAESIAYAKNGARPKPEVRFGETLLTEGIDYKVSYANNKKPALLTDDKAPYLYITGMGNFKGNTKNTPVKFSILKADIGTQAVLEVSDVLYKNKKNNYVPAFTLIDKDSRKRLAKKSDYAAAYTYEIWDAELGDYKPFTEVKAEAPVTRTRMRITISGAGNYTESIQAEYEIYAKSIGGVKVAAIPSKVYTGKAIEPELNITVKVKNGNKYTYVPLPVENYEVEYVNNINKGTASVFIYGKGEYGGVKKVTFKITSQKMHWWDYLIP